MKAIKIKHIIQNTH